MSPIQAAFEMPYEDAVVEIQRLDKKWADEFDSNADATLTACLAPNFSRVYDFSHIYLQSMRLRAQSNAIRAAVAVYLSRVRTGRLPETLPESTPGDPFSGKPFAYEKAHDHFILRSGAREDPKRPGANQYEFGIK